jgi:RNA polymerase sigma factor (TIGR02999 family)
LGSGFLRREARRMSDVTRVLASIEEGDAAATEQLLPLVYAELKRLARRQLAGERPDHTLSPTALVHEAFLRLVDPEGRTSWQSRRHFFGAASEAMRRILVESARRRRRLKRGGDRRRVDLAEALIVVETVNEDLLALDEALARLETADPEAAELVKLRYFSGLTNVQAAELLEVSPRTAERLWTYARSWLLEELRPGE